MGTLDTEGYRQMCNINFIVGKIKQMDMKLNDYRTELWVRRLHEEQLEKGIPAPKDIASFLSATEKILNDFFPRAQNDGTYLDSKREYLNKKQQKS